MGYFTCAAVRTALRRQIHVNAAAYRPDAKQIVQNNQIHPPGVNSSSCEKNQGRGQQDEEKTCRDSHFQRSISTPTRHLISDKIHAIDFVGMTRQISFELIRLQIPYLLQCEPKEGVWNRKEK